MAGTPSSNLHRNNSDDQAIEDKFHILELNFNRTNNLTVESTPFEQHNPRGYSVLPIHACMSEPHVCMYVCIHACM